MTVRDFLIQQENIVNKHSIPKENEWIREVYLPVVRKPIPQITNDLLNDLFEYLNLSKVSAMNLCFRKQIIEEGEYLKIGFCDTDSIRIDKITGEIKYFSEDNEQLYILARSLEAYLAVYGILSDYDIRGFLGHKYNYEDRSLVLHRCKEIVGDSIFYKFYEESFLNI